ncbi:MAG: hypothetical protein IT209_01745 [Armatimonadetes bacterium]|nr:hypothetical protein [Armatimonadota bacterium]
MDSDDRLIIPQRMRGLLGFSFYLTRGVEKCLWMLPEHVFDSVARKWDDDMSLLDRNSRMLGWRFFGQAVHVQPDKQHRIVIPAELRESVGISQGRQILALGVLNRVELWDLETWREHEAKLDEEQLQSAIDAKYKVETPSAAVSAAGL